MSGEGRDKRVSLDTRRFLSPRHITVAQFMAEMRGFLPDLDPGLSIFTFTKDRTIPSPGTVFVARRVYDSMPVAGR